MIDQEKIVTGTPGLATSPQPGERHDLARGLTLLVLSVLAYGVAFGLYFGDGRVDLPVGLLLTLSGIFVATGIFFFIGAATARYPFFRPIDRYGLTLSGVCYWVSGTLLPSIFIDSSSVALYWLQLTVFWSAHILLTATLIHLYISSRQLKRG